MLHKKILTSKVYILSLLSFTFPSSGHADIQINAHTKMPHYTFNEESQLQKCVDAYISLYRGKHEIINQYDHNLPSATKKRAGGIRNYLLHQRFQNNVHQCNEAFQVLYTTIRHHESTSEDSTSTKEDKQNPDNSCQKDLEALKKKLDQNNKKHASCTSLVDAKDKEIESLKKQQDNSQKKAEKITKDLENCKKGHQQRSAKEKSKQEELLKKQQETQENYKKQEASLQEKIEKCEQAHAKRTTTDKKNQEAHNKKIRELTEDLKKSQQETEALQKIIEELRKEVNIHNKAAETTLKRAEQAEKKLQEYQFSFTEAQKILSKS